MIRKLAAPLILLFVGCAPVNRWRTPSHVVEWPVVLQRASLAIDSGKYANAETILKTYIEANPRTHQARETVFWRALIKLDPGNSASSLTEGLAILDRYLADSATFVYRSEATILKRLAVATQVLQAKAMATPVRDTTVISVKGSGNEAEVAALRAELARTSAELERIKKRLANPNK